MHERILRYLTPLTLCTLMGCPPTENNDLPEDMSAQEQDMATQDMTPQDMGGQDMLPDEDMGQDMSMVQDLGGNEEVGKSVLLQKPATQERGKSAPLSFALKRGTPVHRWTHVVVGNQKRALEEGELKMTCEPLDEGYRCEATLDAQPAPEGAEMWPTGVHTITLTGEGDAQKEEPLDVPLHVHLPWAEIKKRSAGQSSSLALPKHYARCGVDAKIAPLDTGAGVVSVMLNETADQVTLDLSADGLDDPTPAQSVSVVSEDLFASDFEVVRTPDGKISAAWWGYDDANDTFCGVTDHFKSTGASEARGDAFCVASPLPIARIIDSQWLLTPQGDGHALSTRIMAISTDDKWFSFRLFEGDEKIFQESDADDQFLDLAAGDISSANTGFLYTDPVDGGGPQEQIQVWQTSPLELDADGAPRPGTRFTVMTFSEQGQSTASVELSAPFVVKETYVGHSNTGRIFVMLFGEQAEQILYETALTQTSDALLTPVQKQLPGKHVGIERRRQQALDRRRREARIKRQVRKVRQGFAPHRIELVSANGQTTALGRWPWDWRDRRDADRLTHPTNEIIEGPMRVSTGTPEEVPMAVSWVDGASEITMVAPLTASPSTTAIGSMGEELAGTRGALCMTGGGNRVTTQTAAFEPDFCAANEEACRTRIASFDDGHGLLLVPGTSGVMMRLELLGDAWAASAPLELDRFSRPTPVGNAMQLLTSEDHIIFEEPFEGPEPEELTLGLSPMSDDGSGATHAVWSIDTAGLIKGPGLVRFETGPQGPIIDQNTSLEDLVLSAHAGDSGVTVTATIEVTYANASTQATFGQPARYVMQLPQEELLASLKGGDEVTVIDLSARPPLRQDAVTIDPLAIASPPALLAPLLGGRNMASEPWAGEKLIELTEEQSRSALLASTSGEGCGTFRVQSVGADEKGAVLLNTLVEHSPGEDNCADQEIFLGTGDFAGSGNDQAMLSYNRVHRRMRIRRGIRKSTLGRVQLGTMDVNLPADIALGDSDAHLSAVIDDFNGDFIDDVALVTGATAQQQSSTLVLFSDGRGGFLPESALMDALPSTRGVTEKEDELCVAFHDGSSWQCEDEVLESRHEDLYCGETDHL